MFDVQQISETCPVLAEFEYKECRETMTAEMVLRILKAPENLVLEDHKVSGPRGLACPLCASDL